MVKPKPCAAKDSCRRGVSLVERLEDSLQFRAFDAHTRVRNHEVQDNLILVLALGLTPSAQLHPSV
jgi:hypothetical protein